jgi:predicted PurR-regulated permease PerM
MTEGASVDSHAEWTVDPPGIRSIAVTIVVGTGVLYVTREGVMLLAPLLVSILLAYAIEPFVQVCCRFGCPRSLGIVLVYGLLIGGAVLVGLLAQRQIVGFVDTLPATVQILEDSIERARREADPSQRPGAMVHLQNAATELKKAIDASGPRPAAGVARVTRTSPPFSLGTHLADASIAIGAATGRLMAVAILTLLLLFGGEGLKRKVIAIAGERAQKKLTYDVIKAIDRQIEKYLVARALISGIVAAATWFGLWILGVRQPLVLGLIAGALNIVPFIGPAVAVALAAIVAFVQFHTVGMTAVVFGVTGAVAAIEGNLITPWLTSRAGELNTVAVFVSVLFWGWMWDVWGLVLAVPIMVAVKAAADHIEPLQPLGELLGR